jgi:hypothetical protein
VSETVEILLSVLRVGGRLGIVGDKLRMLLPPNCPPELKDAIRQQKAALLQLLRLTFLIVRSDALNAMRFWTPDEATKQALISAGADAGSIYTASELARLGNRRVTVRELAMIHAAKHRFHGRLTEPH